MKSKSTSKIKKYDVFVWAINLLLIQVSNHVSSSCKMYVFHYLLFIPIANFVFFLRMYIFTNLFTHLLSRRSFLVFLIFRYFINLINCAFICVSVVRVISLSFYCCWILKVLINSVHFFFLGRKCLKFAVNWWTLSMSD